MKRRRGLLGFEHRREPLAPRGVFQRRLARSGALAGGIILVSLGIGVLGYHTFGGIERWVDCLYAASMILGGMGPVGEARSDGAKLFASAYALYSGVVLLASVGVFLSPLLHRLLHRFHLEAGEDAAD